MKGFLDFIRDPGVLGIAAGFVIGGALSKLVETFVVGIVDPAIALIFDTSNLTQQVQRVGEVGDPNAVVFSWGAVVALTVNLIIAAVVVYWFVQALRRAGSSRPAAPAKAKSGGRRRASTRSRK